MAQALRVPIFEKTGKYLGIPTEWGQSKKELFAWILARVNSKLEGWKEKLLTKAGKEVLIKSVVQAIPTYAMSIFKLPVSICRAIERHIASFWWQKGDAQRGTHWKNWEVLKTRKDEGGMGFKDLLIFNRAMLGKQAWRLSNSPTALWSKVLKGVYFPHGDLWTARKGQRSSWGWQSLLLGRDTIEANIKWSVGDGKSIKIREDKWLAQGVIGGQANHQEPTMVSGLITANPQVWDQQKIQQLFDANIANEILAIPLSQDPKPDTLVWTGNRAGKYSVKSGYNSAYPSTISANQNRASCSFKPPRSLWTQIWSLSAPPKIRTFLWSLCQNAIPTRENLYKRTITTDPLCPMCSSRTETTEHLFLLCKWTKKIWEDHRLQGANITRQIKRFDQWLMEVFDSRRDVPARESIGLVLWQIWKARNDWIFRAQPPKPVDLLELAQNQSITFSRWTMKPKAETLNRNLPVRWKPPNRWEIKMNIDASWVPGAFTCSIAGIVRDAAGQVVEGFAAESRASSAPQAEAESVLHGIFYLKEMQMRHVERTESKVVQWKCESDSSLIVDSVMGRAEPPWNLKEIVKRCREELSICKNITVEYCPRDANRVADWLARNHRVKKLPLNWLENPPLPLREILCSEYYPSLSCKTP